MGRGVYLLTDYQYSESDGFKYEIVCQAGGIYHPKTRDHWEGRRKIISDSQCMLFDLDGFFLPRMDRIGQELAIEYMLSCPQLEWFLVVVQHF